MPSQKYCKDVLKIKKIYYDPYCRLNNIGVKEERVEGDEEDENKNKATEAKRVTQETDIFDAPTYELEEQLSDNLSRSHIFYTELKIDIDELKVN
ncbi:hypothetical protein PanWU01x14_238320 [Parasponia andersonii]|uniref:Uncharacterized protein n=1 Tax=Parasponia andersonii TaxID=3476 RepID=A0A2P5BHT5_PARAD|nr:hypothetical protein PanWU01x14_238320 [Parasponia andersonii]